MNRFSGVRGVLIIVLVCYLCASVAMAADEVFTESGKLQGVTNTDRSVRIFKGVPFAAPPVGTLRWKPPQPAPGWTSIRQADKFGPPCMQADVFGDIYFRDSTPSEDCLSLVIWVPASAAAGEKLPVLVWFYGGGFVAGSNSEPRYDGEALARKGIIVVSPNYRLGIFGFFSHPELSKESGHRASGNYAFLDQVAALQWVVRNIAGFGGDPQNITIAGESAGSASVSALMASPLSRSLFQKAIGESGAFFPTEAHMGLRLKPRAETEQFGVKFAGSLGAHSLAGMRAKRAEELLQAAAKQERGFAFSPNIDGYFLPSDVESIYAQGKQSQIPLLAGWNADEGKIFVLNSPQKPTAESFKKQAQERFGQDATQFLKLYPASADEEALASAEALAGDDFTVFPTWKWLEMQSKTGNAPVYRYRFDQLPAVKPGAKMGAVPAAEAGARHACEIEYVFQTLKSQEGVPWTEEDFKTSEMMSSYWVNFVKTGNPNGNGLPEWPAYDGRDGYQVMHLSGSKSQAAADALRGRYEFLDAQVVKGRGKQSGGIE